MIHGTEDLVIPVQTILSTATKLGKLDLWEGCSHMIPLEDTNRYIEAIKKFIWLCIYSLIIIIWNWSYWNVKVKDNRADDLNI